MDPSEIEVLTQTDLEHVARVLTGFLERSANAFSFPSLSADSRRALVWTSLFQHLQASHTAHVHALCLATLKILSRDKSDLDSLICEKWISILVERAGLYHLAAYDEESLPSASFPHKDIIVEALKCLYNLSFNSEVARALCSRTCLPEGLVCRLRIYRDLPGKEDIMLFDMKLLFILTAFREDIKRKIKEELHGMEYLVNCLKEILSEAAPTDHSEHGHCHSLTDKQEAVVCEILRIQFNLISCSADPNEESSESEDSMFLQIMPLLCSLLLANTTSQDKQIELQTNVANFLTSVPVRHYAELSPPLGADEARHSYDGCNMDAVWALLDLLNYRLQNAEDSRTKWENVSALLTVMHKASRSCRAQRKFLRSVILPPLRDVSRPPEQGDTLRNRLCRLLTAPAAAARDLAAGFLFILCKEKVGRMVKYTGFGNAAGLLAQRGLLGGGGGGSGRGGAEYSSSSDDSDTEEYRAAQHRLDPVVGCTRPPRANPLEGMSEEQKEYEAMQLVRLLEQLTSSGLIQPARVGEDGRPEPIQHILELRDAPPTRPQS